MNKILPFLLLPFLAACSLTESINSNCGGDSRTLCDAAFGTQDADDRDEQAEVDNAQDAANQAAQAALQAQINALDFQFTNMQAQVNLLTALQASTEANLTTLINQAQYSANTALTQIATLQSEQRIVAVLDPCLDSPGYDEVLLRTSNNQLIAYFEQGGNRFLTIVGPGSYTTTDSSSCAFSVNASNQLCDSLGCR